MKAPFPRSRFVALFLGGALGDALGAPLEFADTPEIARRFGDPPAVSSFGEGLITDDTQMTLWVAEGLVRAHQRKLSQGIPSVEAAVRDGLLRWYVSQEPGERKNLRGADSGALLYAEKIRGKRSPDNQNLSELRALLHRRGWKLAPDELGHSESSGALSRSAPYVVFSDVEECYEYALRGAAVTHSNAGATLPAAFYAALLHGLIRELPWNESFARALSLLGRGEGAQEVQAALTAFSEGEFPQLDVAALGGGWSALSVLKIAMKVFIDSQGPESTDIRVTLFRGAAHAGKSDTVCALVGQMLGASCGLAALPNDWLQGLEVRGLAESLASDLFDAWIVGSEHELSRYPAG